MAIRRTAAVLSLFLTACLATVTPTSADEATADVAKSREVTVGSTRVVLLQVGRVVDFVGEKVRKDRSSRSTFRFVYLVEHLGDGELHPFGGAESVMFPGTEKEAGNLYRTVKVVTSATVYEKQPDGVLPPLKAKEKAYVVAWSAKDVTVTGPAADLRLRVGTAKGERHTVVFKNVPLE